MVTDAFFRKKSYLCIPNIYARMRTHVSKEYTQENKIEKRTCLKVN